MHRAGSEHLEPALHLGQRERLPINGTGLRVLEAQEDNLTVDLGRLKQPLGAGSTS